VSTPFSGVLQTLSRHRGVRASLIVSERDGLVVDANVRFGQDGERIAALAASVYRKARLSAEVARFGAVTFLQLEAERGSISVAGGPHDLVVVLTDPGTNAGLIRVEVLKALESLA
jgi:predicted regulator of Ras-like GTPase activity (Roadblock/LC7/MglB family)